MPGVTRGNISEQPGRNAATSRGLNLTRNTLRDQAASLAPSPSLTPPHASRARPTAGSVSPSSTLTLARAFLRVPFGG